jgi:sodium transport system permease protein
VNLRVVHVVYSKELRETLRDRRTLAVMILLPLVLYPMVSVLAAEWLISHETSRQARRSAVVLAGPGAESGPVHDALVAPDALLDVKVDPGRKLAPGGGVRELRGADALVVVPADAEDALAGDGTLELPVYYDSSDDVSNLAEQRVAAALKKLGEARLATRLEDEGLQPEFVKPLSLSSVSLASRSKVGRAEVAKILPIVIVLMVLMGAFYPAIDLTAGEKERGTLEPLLATPAPRRALLAGKLLTVATISALTGLLNLLCIAGAGVWIARSATKAAGASLPLGGLLGAIPWGAVCMGVFALAVATLLFSGLMMAVASLARSFKEAQNFLTPVYLVMTLPAMIAWLPGTKLSFGAALVPIVNVTLLLKDAIAGTLLVGPAVLALVASCGWAAACLALAAKIYDSERLLFAAEATEGGPSGWRQLLRAFMPGPRAADAPATYVPLAFAPGEALALFAGCALMLLGPGVELQARGLAGLAASLWVCLAVPVALFARWRMGADAAVALGLRRPRPRHLVGAALVGSSAWIVLVALILPLQEYLFPTPPAISDALRSLVAPDDALWLKLFAVAVTPAICEELLMRGVVLRSLVKPLGHTGAVVVSALLFAILHLSAYRFVPTFMLGLLLGTVALSSRSLWPAMLVHALNNASVVVLTGPAVSEHESSWSLPFAGAGLALLAAGFALLLPPRGSQR